jgi:predicted nucleic acid-binding Zn ribbon protein
MREDGPSSCEVCGGALRRVIHPTGIIFKGSGFYSTDARRPTKHGAGTKPEGHAEKADGRSGSEPTGSAADTAPAKGGSPSPADPA